MYCIYRQYIISLTCLLHFYMPNCLSCSCLTKSFLIEHRMIISFQLPQHHSQHTLSSLLKYRLDILLGELAPSFRPRMSALIGNLKCSLLIHLFRSFGANHSHTFLSFFSFITSELTHSVGSSICLTIPSSVSLSSSFFLICPSVLMTLFWLGE